MKQLAMVGAGLGAAPLCALLLAVTVMLGSTGGDSAVARATDIPASLVPVYGAAATRCQGLPWTVLAAIGWHESRHGGGHVDPATGDTVPPIRGPALDGTGGTARMLDPSEPDGFVHARGPMQFLQSTFDRWAVVAPARPARATPSPDNAWDAIHTAARFLCNGADRIGDVNVALFRYNHSAAYVTAVLAKAAEYERAVAALATAGAPAAPGPPAPPGTRYVGDAALAAYLALTKVGAPYVYGATGPNAFDCSGLVVWAFARVGVALARTTYQQVLLGDEIAVADIRAGDLLFSRGDVPVRDYGHVAIALDGDTMVVAPHTGAVVKVVPIDVARVQSVRRVAFAR